VWRNLTSVIWHVLRIADDAPFELSAHRSTFGVGGEYSFSTSDALLINCLQAVESGHWILSAELPSNEGFLADSAGRPVGAWSRGDSIPSFRKPKTIHKIIVSFVVSFVSLHLDILEAASFLEPRWCVEYKGNRFIAKLEEDRREDSEILSPARSPMSLASKKKLVACAEPVL